MPGLGQGPGDPEVLIIMVSSWIPAFAGMTKFGLKFHFSRSYKKCQFEATPFKAGNFTLFALGDKKKYFG